MGSKHWHTIHSWPICCTKLLHIIFHIIKITNKFQTIYKKCENENVDANLKVRKLGNVFLNAQHMSTYLSIYIVLSLPLYHTSRSFHFLIHYLHLNMHLSLNWTKTWKSYRHIPLTWKQNLWLINIWNVLKHYILALNKFVMYYSSNNHDLKKDTLL
jgi:hypothetical protein